METITMGLYRGCVIRRNLFCDRRIRRQKRSQSRLLGTLSDREKHTKEERNVGGISLTLRDHRAVTAADVGRDLNGNRRILKQPIQVLSRTPSHVCQSSPADCAMATQTLREPPYLSLRLRIQLLPPTGGLGTVQGNLRLKESVLKCSVI